MSEHPEAKIGRDYISAKDWFNPVEWMERHGLPAAHVTYDPALATVGGDYQYRMIRGTTHDGTYMFTLELIGTALAELASRTTYATAMGLPPEGQQLAYTVGPARLATRLGLVDIPVGRYPGERQRLTIPVRCAFVPALAILKA